MPSALEFNLHLNLLGSPMKIDFQCFGHFLDQLEIRSIIPIFISQVKIMHLCSLDILK